VINVEFLKEIDFEETSIGKVPKEWKVAKLETVADIRGNKGMKDADKIAFIPMESVPDSQTFAKFKVKKREEIRSFTYCEAGDLLLAKITPSLENGKQGIVPFGVPNGVALATTEVFPIHTHDVNTFFLFYLLKFSRFRNKIISSMIGTTGRQRASKESVERLEIPLPKPEEQQRIAEILSFVDSAVELADKVIAKTERLKKGLMQQLLTRGIGHKEYKETPIGKIPKDWNLVELRELVLDVQNGFATGKRDEKGIAQIRMNNLTTDGRLLLDSYLKVPIPEKINRYLLTPNDFLFNNTNSIDLVGKSAIFKGAPFPCTFSNHFTRIRFKEDLVNPELILHHFITQWEKGHFKSVAIRHVGQAAVHTEYLLRLKIPLPPLSEQQKIVEIFSTTNRKLELERQEKVRVEKIKAGLMDLLLTGKVRIKVD
jgi:type I restriction enzyme S subunit